MTERVWTVAGTLDEQCALLDAQLARDAATSQRDRAQRNASRLASVLGIVASTIAMYDLSLLATMGH